MYASSLCMHTQNINTVFKIKKIGGLEGLTKEGDVKVLTTAKSAANQLALL